MVTVHVANPMISGCSLVERAGVFWMELLGQAAGLLLTVGARVWHVAFFFSSW